MAREYQHTARRASFVDIHARSFTIALRAMSVHGSGGYDSACTRSNEKGEVCMTKTPSKADALTLDETRALWHRIRQRSAAMQRFLNSEENLDRIAAAFPQATDAMSRASRPELFRKREYNDPYLVACGPRRPDGIAPNRPAANRRG